MPEIISFALLFGGISMICGSSLTTDYYQALIEQEQEKAKNFELPQKNAEFQSAFESTETIDFGYFDFIIVGAGAAGSVLATRLSEIDSWKILLLEAGGEENDFSDIPAMAGFLQFSEMNWGYYTTPQTNSCLGMKDRKCMAPRGKTIGGCTTINSLVYSRGNPLDFDKWVELGNPGWSYKEVLPYFKKSENSQIDGDFGYHGLGGLWNIEYPIFENDLYSYFALASAELNLPELDYNGKNQLGVSKVQIYTINGRRQSIGKAFLADGRKRDNLKLITRALVAKIIIDEKTKTAQGVVFLTKDKKFKAYATKEVIISGGAYNSPQLLMLSGIGPQEHLNQLGIHMIKDLPVGRSLTEHPKFLGLSFRINPGIPDKSTEELIKQYLRASGRYTFFNSRGIGFLHSGDVPVTVPMLEITFNPPGGTSGELGSKTHNFNDEIATQYLSKKNSSTDIDIFVMLKHQKSRGTVTLKSNSPLDFPEIDLNLLSDPEDITNLLYGIEFVLELLETEAFRELGATLIDIPICSEFEKYSREFWTCVLRQMTTTLYHPSGTTRMGPDPATSVVNSELNVHGLQKLRVVDAGVIPSTISGHTSAVTVMIAEKISDVIKNEHGSFAIGKADILSE